MRWNEDFVCRSSQHLHIHKPKRLAWPIQKFMTQPQSASLIRFPETVGGDNKTFDQASMPSTNNRNLKMLWSLTVFSIVMAPTFELPAGMYLTSLWENPRQGGVNLLDLDILVVLLTVSVDWEVELTQRTSRIFMNRRTNWPFPIHWRRESSGSKLMTIPRKHHNAYTTS